MATTFKPLYGTANSTLTITLNALGNAVANQSDGVDNSVPLYLDVALMVKVATTATSVSSTGSVEFYGFGDVGGGFRTDTAGLAAGSAGVSNARLIGVLQANSGNTTYAGGPWSVSAAFGGIMPTSWGVIAMNRTGAQLTNSASVQLVVFQGYQEQGV